VSARALALAQSSREEEALVLARRAVESAPDGGYEHAALALAAAACGRMDLARDATEAVMAFPRATYLDRLTAQLALAAGDLGPDGDAALSRARHEFGVGEDQVAVALVALAAAVRAEALGHTDGSEQFESDRLLGELGLADTRWRDLFRRAAGHAAAPAAD
jgi:hypothetical protein